METLMFDWFAFSEFRTLVIFHIVTDFHFYLLIIIQHARIWPKMGNGSLGSCTLHVHTAHGKHIHYAHATQHIHHTTIWWTRFWITTHAYTYIDNNFLSHSHICLCITKTNIDVCRYVDGFVQRQTKNYSFYFFSVFFFCF